MQNINIPFYLPFNKSRRNFVGQYSYSGRIYWTKRDVRHQKVEYTLYCQHIIQIFFASEMLSKFLGAHKFQLIFYKHYLLYLIPSLIWNFIFIICRNNLKIRKIILPDQKISSPRLCKFLSLNWWNYMQCISFYNRSLSKIWWWILSFNFVSSNCWSLIHNFQLDAVFWKAPSSRLNMNRTL